MNPDSIDSNLFEIDWTNTSPRVKKEVLEYHVHRTDVSRRADEATGAYIANFRTLAMLLLVSLGMSLYGAENRSILLTVTSLQFIKTLMSKLFEASMLTALDIAKKDFSKFLKRKLLT